MKALPIGIDDFKELIEKDYYYIDKTMLIDEILTNKAKVTLYTRPRRFGKTLNMSMMKYFFDIENSEENKKLFRGLKIEKTENFKHFGQHPVIYISMKDIKGKNWDAMKETIKLILNELVDRYAFLQEKDKEVINNILHLKEETSLSFILRMLSKLMYEHYNKKVVILIDEYDSPMIQSYIKCYGNEANEFFRDFYGSSLKGNPYLEFAVMTGIMRIGQQNIFSALNNIKVYSILLDDVNEYYGFTEEEVFSAMREYGLDNYEEVRKWYNGYIFGEKRIYNPWSINNYLSDRKVREYWTRTATDEIFHEIFAKNSKYINNDLRKLLNGETIEKEIFDTITSHDLTEDENIYNLMVYTGYLTVEKVMPKNLYALKIVNYEVKERMKQIVTWISVRVPSNVDKMIEYMEERNVEEIRKLLEKIMKSTASYYDFASENSYHMFVLGILINAKDYKVISNRESGLGRFDIMLEGKGKQYILEFEKSNKEKNLEADSQKALDQIIEKKYSEDAIKYGIAFYGKNCCVKNL